MIVRFFITFLFFIGFCLNLVAQNKVTQANCGDKITGEFTSRGESHLYEISLQPGQVLEAKAIPIGDYLQFRADFFDPLDTQIMGDGFGTYATPNQRFINLKTGVISARGKHKVVLRNYRHNYTHEGLGGVYTIQFTCTTP